MHYLIQCSFGSKTHLETPIARPYWLLCKWQLVCTAACLTRLHGALMSQAACFRQLVACVQMQLRRLGRTCVTTFYKFSISFWHVSQLRRQLLTSTLTHFNANLAVMLPVVTASPSHNITCSLLTRICSRPEKCSRIAEAISTLSKLHVTIAAEGLSHVWHVCRPI